MSTSKEKSFTPSPEEREKSIETLQTRFDALYTKFGIDPNKEVNVGDINFMMEAGNAGTKEWIQSKLEILKDLIQEANLGDEEFQQADEALKSWENYESPK